MRGGRVDQQDETTLNRAERLILALLGAVLVFVTAIAVIRVATPDENPIGRPEDRPTPGSEIELPISVADALDLAMPWAEEWNDEARLILVSSQFERSGDEPVATPSADLGWIMLSYAAPREGEEWPRVSILVSRASGAIYYEETLSSTVEPPPEFARSIGDMPVTAEQAFRIAEQVAGESYREGCEPSRRQAQVVLDATDRDDIAWVVVYYDQRERAANDIVVRINADTGETNTDARGDVTCDVAGVLPGVVTNKPAVERVHLLVREHLDRQRAAVAA